MNHSLLMHLEPSDGALQTAILNWIIQRIEAGKIEPFLNAGAAPEKLNRVRQLGTRLSIKIASAKRPFVAIEVDLDALMKTISALEQTDQYQEQLMYFVEHGATNPMLRNLFRLSREDISRYREMLPDYDSRGGRTPLPAIGVRDNVWSMWRELCVTVSDKRARFIALHQAFEKKFTLATLYAIVNEYEVMA